MFSILLVDDELAAIDAIQKRVDWDRLLIDNVCTAMNGQRARDVLARQKIDMILCDIEMPSENGIELIRWVTANHPQILCIFLTCHADFDYAKQALQAGAFDYLLKPVLIPDLEAVLEKAVEKIRQDTLQAQYLQYGEQWVRNQDAVIATFWLDVLHGNERLTREQVEKRIRQKKLDITLAPAYLPARCSIRQWTPALSRWPRPDLDYAFHNILQEIFTAEGRAPLVVTESSQVRMVLLPLEAGGRADGGSVRRQCGQFIDAVRTYFDGSVCLYVGEPAAAEALHREYAALRRMEEQNVSYDSMVFPLEAPAPDEKPELQGKLPLWKNLLSSAHEEALYGEVQALLEEAVREGRMSGSYLSLFYHEFLQMLYGCLAEKNIPAKTVLPRPEDSRHALDSVENALEHIRQLLGKAAACMNRAYNGATVLDMVKAYIHEHIGEELSRDDIAAEVYLNPSYLSRMFHQKTGQSLTAYISDVRLDMVRSMLLQTNLSVSDIARRTGYVNMPYFCKVFKRSTSMTPMEYRNKADGAEGNKKNTNRPLE